MGRWGVQGRPVTRVMSEQRPDLGEGAQDTDPGTGNSRCKGPEAEKGSDLCWGGKEAAEAGELVGIGEQPRVKASLVSKSHGVC